jgi:hypothetical protein
MNTKTVRLNLLRNGNISIMKCDTSLEWLQTFMDNMDNGQSFWDSKANTVQFKNLNQPEFLAVLKEDIRWFFRHMNIIFVVKACHHAFDHLPAMSV